MSSVDKSREQVFTGTFLFP